MATSGQLASYSQTAQIAYAAGLVAEADNTDAYKNLGAGMSQSQADQNLRRLRLEAHALR